MKPAVAIPCVLVRFGIQQGAVVGYVQNGQVTKVVVVNMATGKIEALNINSLNYDGIGTLRNAD